MCGRYNVTDSTEVRRLMEQLGLPGVRPRVQLNVPPGGQGEFVMEDSGGRQLVPGVWSLLIEPKPGAGGFRPNPKFQTFNARADRLTTSPLWKKAFPARRCILPVSGFHEWKGRQVYFIHPQGEATALAGLWQHWVFGDVSVGAFTVITLPPHPRFRHIHPKSIPLILRPSDFDRWLDPAIQQPDAFQDLLETHIAAPLVCTPVASTNDLSPVGESEVIPAD